MIRLHLPAAHFTGVRAASGFFLANLPHPGVKPGQGARGFPGAGRLSHPAVLPRQLLRLPLRRLGSLVRHDHVPDLCRVFGKPGRDSAAAEHVGHYPVFRYTPAVTSQR